MKPYSKSLTICGVKSDRMSLKRWRGRRAWVTAQRMPIINKKLLREIDRRVRYLRKRLEEVRVVDYSPQQDGKVFFGAWVEIENDAGESLCLRIVGPDEIYQRKDYISIDSPMARALLKKSVDDEALVETPSGKKSWYINRIRYLSAIES